MRGAVVLLALLVGLPRGARSGETTIEAAGHHYRLDTERGTVHLWTPRGYDGATAGIVIFLHGYYMNADQTWSEANLPEQFAASGRNALFVVPESPNSSNQRIQWPSLGGLLETLRRRSPQPLPKGPLVVIGHSGAFRTVVNWLRDGRIQDVVLLDGLYKNERDFYWWLQRAPGHAYHRLTLVSAETLENAEKFARRFGRTPTRGEVPARYADFSSAETQARLLLIRSQYEHMEIVTSGKVIPVVLHLPPLRAVIPDSQKSKAGRR